VQLTAEGGHAGNDRQHAAIRRWIAPADGSINISGLVQHEYKEGDGIRAYVISARLGLLGFWALHNNKVETNLENVQVKAGDTIDFVVDLGQTLSHDMFKWAPNIVLNGAGGATDIARAWSSKKEFGGPAVVGPKPLTVWEKYAQALLLSNEFLFLD
jgi:hypothetical protein